MAEVLANQRTGESAASSIRPASPMESLAVAAVSALLIGLAVLATCCRGSWDPDELKYGQIVQGMDSARAFFVPHLWGEIYPDKPPLYFWLALASSRLFGGTSFAALVTPAVLAAVGGLWLVARVTRRWYGARTGALAAVVLATMPLYLFAAQIGRMDMLMAVFITGAVSALHEGYVEGHRPARIAAFVAMGLGVLAKGPFGAVFPIAILVSFLMLAGRLRQLACWETAVGLAAFGAVVAVWLGPAVWLFGSDYLEALLGRQVLQRAISGLAHPEPGYFYLWLFPLLLLPWAVLLRPAVCDAWRRWRQEQDERSLWLLCWSAVPVVILSCVREKLPIYLLPAMAPVAILVAHQWQARSMDEPSVRASRWRLLTLYGGICMGGFVLWYLGESAVWSQSVRPVLWGGVLLMGVGVLGWMTAPRIARRPMVTFAVLASMAPVGIAYLDVALVRQLDESKSWRSIAAAVRSFRRPVEPVVTFQLRPYIGYYLSSDVVRYSRSEELVGLVAQHRTVCCAVRGEHLGELGRMFQVTSESDRTYPSPKGPIHVVRLSQRAVATSSAQHLSDPTPERSRQ